MMLFVIVLISLMTIFMDSSMGCLQTADINADEQWACWDLDRTAGRYISPNKCCTGLTCECDETGNFTSNARFGKDCKCISPTESRLVNEYYARIGARQQQNNATGGNQV